MVDATPVEGTVRARFDAGDLDGAMAAAIAGYGAELFGFLVGLSRDHDRAADLFGAACERLWRGLPAFRWDSSFRVWAYTIARNEFLRSLRHVTRERKQVPLSRASQLSAMAARARATTPPYRRTEVKDAFARLREQLAPEDHMLLGLRLDKRMAWSEIAAVLGTGDVARDAAKLRKRYQRLKTRLRELAREAGGVA
jgi:RNA polymerase sigma-70 factor (ECF subfamily)